MTDRSNKSTLLEASRLPLVHKMVILNLNFDISALLSVCVIHCCCQHIYRLSVSPLSFYMEQLYSHLENSARAQFIYPDCMHGLPLLQTITTLCEA